MSDFTELVKSRLLKLLKPEDLPAGFQAFRCSDRVHPNDGTLGVWLTMVIREDGRNYSVGIWRPLPTEKMLGGEAEVRDLVNEFMDALAASVRKYAEHFNRQRGFALNEGLGYGHYPTPKPLGATHG